LELTDYFQSPPADRVFYHYTSVDTLINVVSHGTLRAGHAAYMNDSMELKHALKVLEETLLPLTVFGEMHALDVRFYMELIEWVGLIIDTSHPCFIFSLSEEASLLSQWRSYTKAGKGVSIGFNADRLRKIASLNEFVLARCLYDEDAQKVLMHKLATHLYDTFDESGAQPTKEARFTHFETSQRDIFLTLALIKHKAFSEEKEWRLIAYNRHKPEAIGYREGPFMLVPYVEIDLKKIGPGPQLFDYVILGPTQHRELALSAANGYLKAKGFCPFVTATDIPFRHW
jgi:hypothetical protein